MPSAFRWTTQQKKHVRNEVYTKAIITVQLKYQQSKPNETILIGWIVQVVTTIGDLYFLVYMKKKNKKTKQHTSTKHHMKQKTKDSKHVTVICTWFNVHRIKILKYERAVRNHISYFTLLCFNFPATLVRWLQHDVPIMQCLSFNCVSLAPSLFLWLYYFSLIFILSFLITFSISFFFVSPIQLHLAWLFLFLWTVVVLFLFLWFGAFFLRLI